jgi:hypothetical protein
MNTFILPYWNYIKRSSRLALLPLAIVSVLAASMATSIATAQAGQAAGRQAGPQAGPHPLRLVLARRSTADPVEVMKHFSQNCPNVAITTSERNSDYMLYAGGWSGNYRFMLIRKGGDVLYTTETALLSNSVKNVCKYLSAH